MKKTLVMFLTLVMSLLVATTASANDNAGAWVKLDAKHPLVKVDANHLNLRLTPEFVFLDNAGGLSQTVLRAGFQHSCTSWFNLTLNGVDNVTIGGRQDVMAEIQPEFTWVANSALTFKDRNRVDFRALDLAAGNRWLYANELKVVVTPEGSPVAPWVAYEGFVNLNQGEMNQHQARAALAHKLDNGSVLSLGYMFRSRQAVPDWSRDHMMFLSVEH